MRSYELDKKAASESGPSNKRISESGSYTGKFKFAWGETNDKGNESVNLFFLADNGQECGPLALYTHNAKGEPFQYSFGIVNAIMACLRVRSMKPVAGPVTLYDFDAKEDVTKTKQTFPELVSKPIGLLIQMEEYTGRNGLKHKPQIIGAYEASTRLTAKEILSQQTDPRGLDGMEKWLAANPVRKQKEQRPTGTPPISGDASFADDDIPF